MLGSITPLGERSRGHRWTPALLWFAGASTVAGAALGVGLGLLGSIVLTSEPSRLRLWALGVLAAASVLADALLAGSGLPGPRRQVNDSWLRRYRRWVYAAGFGAQLGIGYATVVTTSALYVATIGAVLSGGALPGAVIMGVYGAVRGAMLLPARRVRSPSDLSALLRRADRLRAAFSDGLGAAQLLLAVAMVLTAVLAS